MQPPGDRVSGAGLLVVEDDDRIGSSLATALEAHGYTVEWARDGAGALACIDESTAVVILDLGLPDIDGIELCRSLRARAPDTQILILTARGDEVDVVVGLDAGADDYVVKPFGLAELLARIRVCERRRPSGENVSIGDLVIVVEAHQVSLGGAPVDLTRKEFELLVLLARRVGEVVTRAELVESVWNDDPRAAMGTLHTHMWSLRRKLDRTGRRSCITTVRRVGYRLERM